MSSGVWDVSEGTDGRTGRGLDEGRVREPSGMFDTPGGGTMGRRGQGGWKRSLVN